MNTTQNKKHADFQDAHRRSSNFNRTIPKEEFEIKGNGHVSLDNGRLIKSLNSQLFHFCL